MNVFLPYLVLIPIVGFLTVLTLPAKHERLISGLSLLFISAHMLLGQICTFLWLIGNSKTLNFSGPSLISSGGFDFFISLYYDKVSAVFLTLGGILTFLIIVYSRYYMHRETGFKRFFSSVLFFYVGYNTIILAGNFEVLMTGWEVLGISSFLLIAFYRDRYLPVKNALKIFSLYRLGDLGLILTAWISHILMEENITFAKLNDLHLVTEHLSSHSLLGFTIAFLILISAAVKSGQFPFSFWVPRAMEGPTPSSAIFYGSLSVHMGCFILMRTYPIWEHQISARILIGMCGIVTAIVTTGCARVQATVKSQIAYASLTQIGLIFVEIALGLESLALFHLAGNAFLRTYQLLVSPSVVSYLIRAQFYKQVVHEKTIEDSLSSKLRNALYIIAMKEWNLDFAMERFLWRPFKKFGRRISFLRHPLYLALFILLSFAALGYGYMNNADIETIHVTSTALAVLGLLLTLQAFAERKQTKKAWTMIAGNHLWIAAAISMNDMWQVHDILIYLSGVIVSWFLGMYILHRLQKIEGLCHLTTFQGHSYDHPTLAFVFLLASLGLSGFPITPTFVGEDLIFHHIPVEQAGLAIATAISYVFNGLAIMRIYARIFLGTHVKTHHEIAHRSA